MKGVATIKSCVLVLAGFQMVLLAGCLTPSSRIGTDSGFRQQASICVSKRPDGYYVQTEVTESRFSSPSSGQRDTLSPPAITTIPNEWATMSVCTTNGVRFDTDVVLGEDKVTISHFAGILLKVMVQPTKQEDIVHARGILSVAEAGADPRVGHRVLPFDLECKIGKKTVFFQESCTPKQ